MLARLLSLVLLAIIGLPTVAPALALAQDPDAGLPVCCRRHGQHHCAVSMERMAQLSRDQSQPQIGAVCPSYPRHEVAPVAGAHLLAFHAPQRAAVFFAAAVSSNRVEMRRRILHERSHYKRGPPSAFSHLT
jgi:hypothetical protein